MESDPLSRGAVSSRISAVRADARCAGATQPTVTTVVTAVCSVRCIKLPPSCVVGRIPPAKSDFSVASMPGTINTWRGVRTAVLPVLHCSERDSEWPWTGGSLWLRVSKVIPRSVCSNPGPSAVLPFIALLGQWYLIRCRYELQLPLTLRAAFAARSATTATLPPRAGFGSV